jgi:hypothetical protein
MRLIVVSQGGNELDQARLLSIVISREETGVTGAFDAR